MSAPKPITPADGHAIIDKDGRLIEDSATGKLAIFYAADDAAFALPAIKRVIKNARIVPVHIHRAR